MSEIGWHDVTLSLAGTPVLNSVSLTLEPGQLVAVLGANGAGKTSLLRTGLGLTRPDAGSVMLNGRDMGRYSAQARARLVAYLPQQRTLAWPTKVREVVALGRFAYGASPTSLSRQDKAAVEQAMDDCGLVGLAARSCDSLSGGELARVHCARALAVGAPFLFADEPTAALDPRHQLQMMGLLRDYVDRGGAALVVLHDVQQAVQWADRFVWMREGRVLWVDDAGPDDLAARIRAIYDVEAEIGNLGAITVAALRLKQG